MSLLRLLAAPLAPLYGALVRARNRSFDAHPERAARVEVPVVSLGNLSTGGTGKSPLTLFLAQSLAKAGQSTVVLSRGYGGRRPVDPMDVEPSSDPRQTGDEPLMMARRLGPGRVVVGRKRHAAALRALSREPRPDVLLLDDGYQHRALHRDLDLLLLDGVRRWGNGRMLPSGHLREPMEEARRAHALVLTRASRAPLAEVEAWWAQYGSGGPLFTLDFTLGALRHGSTGETTSLPGASPGPLFAFCGLGHPEAFYADLILAGLPWVGIQSFRDHHPWSERDLQALATEALRLNASGLVCTEKDAVKLDPAWVQALPLPLWIAEQQIEGGEALAAWVLERVQVHSRKP